MAGRSSWMREYVWIISTAQAVCMTSSLVRSSMRFSASSRYLEQRRARATPSSKTLSESSRGSSPVSRRSTISSRRWRASSNLMSLIPFPDLRDAGAEGALVQQDLEQVAGPRLRCRADERARRQPRHAIASREDGEGREALEAAHRGGKARARRLDAVRGPGDQPPAELAEQRNIGADSRRRIPRAQSLREEREAVADLSLARA